MPPSNARPHALCFPWETHDTSRTSHGMSYKKNGIAIVWGKHHPPVRFPVWDKSCFPRPPTEVLIGFRISMRPAVGLPVVSIFPWNFVCEFDTSLGLPVRFLNRTSHDDFRWGAKISYWSTYYEIPVRPTQIAITCHMRLPLDVSRVLYHENFYFPRDFP